MDRAAWVAFPGMGQAKTAAVLSIVLTSLAVAPASQPTTQPAESSYPALQKKLVVEQATIDALKLRVVEAESAKADAENRAVSAEAELEKLKTSLTPDQKRTIAAADNQATVIARARAIHAFAQDGNKLYEGMSDDKIVEALGRPDRIARDGEHNLCSWIAGDYELIADVWAGQVTTFRERGNIPR